ncbi:uncharacterized protein V1510DRAFT_419070 [Dipodascopsis tothii]|uniref:uncharacterized protein n=1 Tax=Dipodascopsis tothii TaxID=44089 RepID=UPI0034CFEF4A
MDDIYRAAVGARRAELVCELEVLHLIVHRNRNQHRLATWWKYVGIVHRNLNYVLTNTEAASKRRDRSLERCERRAQEALARGEIGLLAHDPIDRIKYLVYRVLPKACRAAYGVISTGQFVPLGLTLVACFSKLWWVLKNDVLGAATPAKSEKAEEPVPAEDGSDLGEVIAREVDEPVVAAPAVASGGDDWQLDLASEDDEAAAPGTTPAQAPAPDKAPELAPAPPKPTSIAAAPGDPSTKPKKKKKSSQVPQAASGEKRKKKKRKTDAIDDIFSGFG